MTTQLFLRTLKGNSKIYSFTNKSIIFTTFDFQDRIFFS